MEYEFDENAASVEQLNAWLEAATLTKQGYRKISSKYKLVARIDKDDWLDILARQLNCCRADFYKLDGSGIANNWKDHYIRVHSKDRITVTPEVYKHMKNYLWG
jgi:hypothetical protein